MKRIISWSSLSACVAVLISSTALAQSSGVLEEIIVTAQKREQSLQDVPVSITAFTGTELLDRGVDGIVEIQEMTANLRADSGGYGSNGPSFALRGVGSETDTSTVSSSPVAVHMNEVSAPYPVTTSDLLFDLERVEILRGPQGDLFGLNTTGGTINFITRKPTDEFDSSIMVEAANYERYKFEGFISGSLSDTFSARLAIAHNERNEGPQSNATTNEDYGRFERTGARLSLRYKPTDVLTADLVLHVSRRDDEPLGPRSIDDGWSLGFAGNADPEILDDPWGIQYNTNPVSRPGQSRPNLDHEGFGGSLRIDYSLASSTFTSLTGYQDFDRKEFLDMDGAEAQGGYRAYLSDLSSFSQEFRLASNSDNQLQWMVGANFATDELQQTTIFDQPDNLLFPAVGGQVPLQERDVWAVFTHLDYSLNDRWSIFGGLRYTDEERTQEKIGTYLFADPLGIFGGFFAESPDLANFVPGALLTDHCGITGGVGDCSNNPQPLTDEIGGEEWSGKLGVNFFMSDDTLLYGWIARGTKSGGFNDVAAANSESYIPSEPEFLNAIELGTKTTLLDGTLRINASAFYYDYEDQQVGGQILSRFFGLLGALVNAPESEVKGGEIEVLWSPNDVLTLRQNVGYLNAKFDTHSSLNGAGITAYRDDCIAFTMANCDWVMPDPSAPWYNPNLHVGTNDLSGERFGGPRWSLSGSAELRFAVGSDYELSFYADYNYSEAALSDERAGSRGQFTILNNPAALPSDVPSFLFDSTGDGQGDTRVVRGGYDWVFINGRITLSKGDAWDLALFGRNLADEYRYSFGSFNDGANIIPDEPRTWGVRFRYNFN